MSALKEKQLVTENQDGRLVFPPVPPPTELHLTTPQCMCPQCKVRWRHCRCAWTAELRARIHNPPHQAREWGYKGTQTLRSNPPPPRTNHTPHHWKASSLHQDADDGTFSVRHYISQTPWLPGDLRAVKAEGTKTVGLTLAEAKITGELLEQASKRAGLT